MNKVPADLTEGVSKLAKNVSVAFYPIALYAGITTFSAPAFLKLVDHLNENNKIINERITLELAKEKTKSIHSTEFILSVAELAQDIL